MTEPTGLRFAAMPTPGDHLTVNLADGQTLTGTVEAADPAPEEPGSYTLTVTWDHRGDH